MSEPVLELEGVVKEYKAGTGVVTRALRGVDLVLGRGEFTALIGPSGSGKSTLLNILGLLDQPSAGVLRIGGHNTGQLNEGEITALRGEMLGFIFQFHHLIPALTAEENVMLPLAIAAGRTSRQARDEARRLLEVVGIGHRAAARAAQLSGGEQQRVAIARALIRRPALILADEPTGNLDTSTADAVFRLFRALHESETATFLIVTHDRALAGRCDRTITLVDGRIVA